MSNTSKKGFTLIELLVVIAIIAILAVVVVLTLNPAELLRQARDSNRVSDFATIKSAISLYNEDVSTTTYLDNGTFNLYASYASASTTTSSYETAATWGFLGSEAAVSATSSRGVTSVTAGWIPVNLSAISSGAPISVWPVDPLNTGGNFYVYAATTTAGTWKIATKTESIKYSYNGSNDIESTDGGSSTGTYEQGTNLAL